MLVKTERGTGSRIPLAREAESSKVNPENREPDQKCWGSWVVVIVGCFFFFFTVYVCMCVMLQKIKPF